MAFQSLLSDRMASLRRSGAWCLVNQPQLRDRLGDLPPLAASAVDTSLLNNSPALPPGFYCIPWNVIEDGIRSVLGTFVDSLVRGRVLVVVNTENLGGAGGVPHLAHDLGLHAKSAEWLAQLLVELLEARGIDYVILDRSMQTQADLDGIADLAETLGMRIVLAVVNDVTYRGTQQCAEIEELVAGFFRIQGCRVWVQVFLGVALQAGLNAIRGCCTATTHPHADLHVACGQVLPLHLAPGLVMAAHKIPDSIHPDVVEIIEGLIGGSVLPHYKDPTRFPAVRAGLPWVVA